MMEIIIHDDIVTWYSIGMLEQLGKMDYTDSYEDEPEDIKTMIINNDRDIANKVYKTSWSDVMMIPLNYDEF